LRKKEEEARAGRLIHYPGTGPGLHSSPHVQGAAKIEFSTVIPGTPCSTCWTRAARSMRTA